MKLISKTPSSVEIQWRDAKNLAFNHNYCLNLSWKEGYQKSKSSSPEKARWRAVEDIALPLYSAEWDAINEFLLENKVTVGAVCTLSPRCEMTVVRIGNTNIELI